MLLTCSNKLDLSLKLDNKGYPTEFSINKLDWNAFPVELEVRDDLRCRFYRVSEAETSNPAAGEFLHKWHDADFDVLEKWVVEERKLVRTVQALPHKNIEKRSISFRMLISYPEKVYGLGCWSANEKFPNHIQWVGGLKLFYGDVCYGTLIPAVALYSCKENSGLTFGARPGKKCGGRLSFTFRDYHSEGVDVEFSNLLLSSEHPAECELLYAPCENCFRSALNFWVTEFPEFFAAVNPKLATLPGPFLITNPQMENDCIESIARDYKPLWAEIHNYFSRYGEYIPEEKEFTPIIKHDYPEFECADKFNLNMVHDHIAQLHRFNILALLYLQVSGDCFIPYAEEKFPDAIARDSAGHLKPTWKNCCFVNPSAGTSFHDHMQQQIRKFFAEFPEIDGVFLDQLCYQAVDYAHQDGRTAVNCREASLFGDSYLENLELISKILHSQGKYLWANGPFNLDVAKNIDGMMCEGTSTLARSFQYLACGSKGLLIHSYAESAKDVEYMFRRSLVCGGSWSVSGTAAARRPPEFSDQIKELLAVCGPLSDLLAGCQWVLEPHPFSLDGEYEGNIFQLPNGDLALTVVSLHDTLLRKNRGFDDEIKAVIRCSQCCNIKSVKVYGTENQENAAFEFNNGALSLSICNHRVFSVVILSK